MSVTVVAQVALVHWVMTLARLVPKRGWQHLPLALFGTCMGVVHTPLGQLLASFPEVEIVIN